jgi:hypothetical protein
MMLVLKRASRMAIVIFLTDVKFAVTKEPLIEATVGVCARRAQWDSRNMA